MDLFSSPKELLGDRRGRFYHMLAVIEDDEQLSGTNESEELQVCVVRFWYEPQGCPNGPDDKIRIDKASQVDKVNFSGELFDDGVADSYRNGRLADAAGAHKGNEPFFSKSIPDFIEPPVAPNHPRQSRGQPAWPLDLIVPALGRDRADERVA